MNPADNLIEKGFLWFFILIGKIIGYLIGTVILGIRILFRKTIDDIRNNKQMTIIFPNVKQRLEHTHIVGGSGHGKTQLLQYLFMIDFGEFLEGRGSIIVIDSQGDFIGKILHLADMREVSDKLILIDPSDINYPPALNLFDFGLDRLNKLNPADRERLINGAISLYEYLFGALLGAELTQRQGVIFRYLARLMMIVPDATIHTLMDFMQNPETVRPYLAGLDPISKRFFETQFFDKSFDDTRQQILTRLWGVLSNPVLARMFSSKRNKIDLFDAINRGSIILIYTAKGLLKQEGCEILGRFFIALISQAAQERSIIPENMRRTTYVYIDEAQDYFDKSLEALLTQARKYRIGLILAHQNLGQFDRKLRETVMSNTSIKFAGGVSADDAHALAKEMKCEPEQILNMKKTDKMSEFAFYIKDFEHKLAGYRVYLGFMEMQERLTQEELKKIRDKIRIKYCTINQETTSVVESMDVEIEGVSKHEMV